MAKALTINTNLSIPLEEFDVSFARSSGPGGQNVNKVNSKVIMSWDINTSAALSEYQKQRLLQRIPGSYLTSSGSLLVSSTKERNQVRNRRDCEEKIVSLIQLALARPKIRRATKPTRASKQRRLDSKKRRGQIKKLRQSREQD